MRYLTGTVKSRNIQIITNKIPFNYDKKQWWRGKCNAFRIYRLLISHFLKKKTWKNTIFRIYRPLPYSSRDGENMLSSCPPSTPSVKITPKIRAKFASLNSSIAFGDLRLGGCLRGPPPQAPARAQSPARNTRIKRRKIRGSFVGYFDVPESRVFTPEFLVRAQGQKRACLRFPGIVGTTCVKL